MRRNVTKYVVCPACCAVTAVFCFFCSSFSTCLYDRLFCLKYMQYRKIWAHVSHKIIYGGSFLHYWCLQSASQLSSCCLQKELSFQTRGFLHMWVWSLSTRPEWVLDLGVFISGLYLLFLWRNSNAWFLDSQISSGFKDAEPIFGVRKQTSGNSLNVWLNTKCSCLECGGVRSLYSCATAEKYLSLQNAAGCLLMCIDVFLAPYLSFKNQCSPWLKEKIWFNSLRFMYEGVFLFFSFLIFIHSTRAWKDWM